MNGGTIMRAAVAIRSLEDNPYFAQKAETLFESVDYLPSRPDRQELERLLAHYEVLIIGARERITDEMIRPETLRTKVVGTLSVGTDHLDVPALARYGVRVERCPTANVRSVAEHVITLLLALTKRVKIGDRLVAEGKSRADLPSLPHEVEGKTLGLVGFGNIGRIVGQLGHAFGMNVIATTRSRQAGSDDYVDFHDLDYLLGASDLVSVSVPLTSETAGLIDAARLSRMHRGAVLVNTSRAEVVVERDVLTALDESRLAGYGADYDGVTPDLSRRADVIVTPHIAGITVESNDRLDNELIDRLERLLAG